MLVPTQSRITGKKRDAESNLDYFGARYYTSSLGRFMSPDRMGGKLIDPQTLNKYSYVRDNPVTLTDPTGLYTADCGSGVKNCEKQIKNFDQALQNALKSKNNDIRKAAEAHGKLGEKNGVNVSLVNVVDPKHSNVNGVTTAQADTGGLTYNPKTNTQQATQVTVKAGLSGDTLEEKAVHEGVHVEDRAAVVASISLDVKTGATTGNWSLNITGRQSEINAYGVENIFRGYIGLPLLNIQDILARPPYSDNPTLNQRLFPDLPGGPPQ